MGFPHIGNTGVNEEDAESKKLYLSGVVVREYCQKPSSWRSKESLHDYMVKAGVSGISDVDTREITRILRDEGAQRSVIVPINGGPSGSGLDEAKKGVASLLPMQGRELVSEVSCKEPYEFKVDGDGNHRSKGLVVVYDFGVKANILRHLYQNHFKVMVVPYNTPAKSVLSEKPLAVVLSNGPGDPGAVTHVVDEIRSMIGVTPLLAICMGHQLLARALGCPTYKLKFGHHGVNHPVKDVRSGKILITSQNHGFSVRIEDLNKVSDVSLSHLNLNDQTVEGYYSEKKRLLSVQFHPESAPGPSDASYLFDNFIRGFVQ